jgi:hypothetical protein
MPAKAQEGDEKTKKPLSFTAAKDGHEVGNESVTNWSPRSLLLLSIDNKDQQTHTVAIKDFVGL